MPSRQKSRRQRKNGKAKNENGSPAVTTTRPFSLQAPTATHRFVQRVYTPLDISQTGAATVYKGISFTVGSLPNWGSFLSLYDQYRIKKISAHVIPKYDVNLLVSVADLDRLTPEIFSAIDFDDAAAPASVQELLEYESCIRTRGPVEHVRTWKPSILLAAYESVATSGYVRAFDQWLDCNDDTVPHYGLKLAITPHTTNVTDTSVLYFDTFVEFEVEFQSVK